jgi:hypothetical protein
MRSIVKGYMGFWEGLSVSLAKPEYEGGCRQIDWDKLRQFIEENKAALQSVSAGLAEDWGHTSGEVWNSDTGYIKLEDTYVYGSSFWATPAVELTYKEDGRTEMVECWKLGDNPKDYFSPDVWGNVA